MVRSLIISICALLLLSAGARAVSPWPVVHGRSGQFVVRSVSQRQSRAPAKAWESMQVPVTTNGWAFLLNPGAGPSANAAEMDLEPASLAISCERLKETFLFELGMGDQWRGRIDIRINSTLPENAEPALTAILNLDGWNYDLEVPAHMKSSELYRALVHVLFMEMANRKAGREATQIPLWLVEGMTAELQNSTMPTFNLQPKARTLSNKFELAGLAAARTRLREHAPISFQNLSWPEPDKLSGEDLKLYQACSQLFVHELLRLKDGRACFQQMMDAMPQFANWQLAFLRGFHAHFEQLVDVEKWWALTCVSFTAQAANQKWSVEESWRQLRETLDIPVEVHLQTNRMPAAAEITLQEVIMQWDAEKQLPSLQKVSNQLFMMRLYVDPVLLPLVDQYRATLENYLHDRRTTVHAGRKSEALNNSSTRKSAACKQLTDLDSKRAALREKVLSGRRQAETSALQVSSSSAQTHAQR